MKLQTAIDFIERRFEPAGVEACLVNCWEDGGGEYRVRVFGQFPANGYAYHKDFTDAELAAQYADAVVGHLR